MDAKDFISKVEKNPIEIDLGGEKYEVTKDYLDIRISAKEGFDVEIDGNVFVVLDTEITEDLLDEGYAREFISKIQNLRKDSGFEVTDRINIFYDTDDKLNNSLEKFVDEIKSETLADNLKRSTLKEEKIELNDKTIAMKIERI